MRFSCPTCNQIVQVADEAVGKTVACPTCRQRLKVPGGAPRPAPVDKTVLGREEPDPPHVTSQPRPAPIPAPAPPAPRRRERDDRAWDEEDDRDRGRSSRDRYDDDDDDYRRRPASVNVGLAVAALVCGIVGVIFSWCVIIGPICALLGIVFGGIHLSNKVDQGNGMAISGLATGGAGIVITLIFVIVAVTSRNSMFWFR